MSQASNEERAELKTFQELCDEAIAQTGDPLTQKALQKIGIDPGEMIALLRDSKRGLLTEPEYEDQEW